MAKLNPNVRLTQKAARTLNETNRKNALTLNK